MNFFDWGRHSSTSPPLSEVSTKSGADAQKILAAISYLGGEASLGQLKDVTELSYSVLGQKLKHLSSVTLVEFDFSSSNNGFTPVLIYRLKEARAI